MYLQIEKAPTVRSGLALDDVVGQTIKKLHIDPHDDRLNRMSPVRVLVKKRGHFFTFVICSLGLHDDQLERDLFDPPVADLTRDGDYFRRVFLSDDHERRCRLQMS